EEVLAAAGCAGSVPDRDEVERRADVAEERVVALPGEDRRPVGERVDALDGEVVIVRRRPRADVVGRRREAAADDGRLPARDLRHRVLLLGAAEERGRRAGLEAELPRDIRLAVAVAVDVEVVPRARRERVPVGTGARILAGYPV